MSTDQASIDEIGAEEGRSTEIGGPTPTTSDTTTSTPSSSKKTPTIYTVMFVMAAIFLLIATLMMLNELLRFSPDLWRTDQYRPG